MASADGSGAGVAGCGSGVSIGLLVWAPESVAPAFGAPASGAIASGTLRAGALVSGLGCGSGTVSAAIAAPLIKAATRIARGSPGRRTSALEARRGLVEQRIGGSNRRL